MITVKLTVIVKRVLTCFDGDSSLLPPEPQWTTCNVTVNMIEYLGCFWSFFEVISQCGPKKKLLVVGEGKTWLLGVWAESRTDLKEISRYLQQNIVGNNKFEVMRNVERNIEATRRKRLLHTNSNTLVISLFNVYSFTHRLLLLCTSLSHHGLFYTPSVCLWPQPFVFLYCADVWPRLEEVRCDFFWSTKTEVWTHHWVVRSGSSVSSHSFYANSLSLSINRFIWKLSIYLVICSIYSAVGLLWFKFVN